jgi:DNA-binding winged helix-turn-helix (wHTH) protein
MAIRNQFVNPFYHRGPIRDQTYFFGREDSVKAALAYVNKGQSVSILGVRRIGKTSFLFNLIEQLQLAEQTQRNEPQGAPRICATYIDCENLSQSSTSDVIRVFVEALQEEDAQEDSSPYNLRMFELLIRQLTQKYSLVILLLDEFDALSQNPHLDVTVFSGLRALAMRYGVVYVTASTKPLLELSFTRFNSLSSPFFNFFAQIRLGNFSQSQARFMLQTLSGRSGRAFEDSICSDLLRLAGCQPFLLQIAAYHAFDQITQLTELTQLSSPVKASSFDSHLVLKQFEDEARTHYEHYWNTLSVNDQRLLATLPLRARSDGAGLQQLEHAGLIVYDKEKWQPVSIAFERFVERQFVQGLVQAGPIVIDDAQHLALSRGELLTLTPSEYSILRRLLLQPGEVVSHQQLEACLSDSHPARPTSERLISTNTSDFERLKTTIRSLRKALGNDASCIENVHSVGFRFICDSFESRLA